MLGQEDAWSKVREEATLAGGCDFFQHWRMSDEAGLRLSVDTNQLLLPSQRPSRWPIERVRCELRWRLLGSTGVQQMPIIFPPVLLVGSTIYVYLFYNA